MPDVVKVAEEVDRAVKWLTRPGAPTEDHALGMLLGMQLPIILQNRANSLPNGMLPYRVAYMVAQVLARMEKMS